MGQKPGSEIGNVGAFGRRGQRILLVTAGVRRVLVLLITLSVPPFTRWRFPTAPVVLPWLNADRHGTSGRPSPAGVKSRSFH